MCGKDGTQVTLLKSADGRSFRCRRCHHAVCIEVYKAEAHKKLEQLSLSLPRSINDDDASMLARAKEPVREWYRSWSRTTMLSVLITGLPGEGKTLPVAARIRALANEAVEEYANGKGASELFDWVSGVYFVRAYDLAEASHEYKAGCPEIERAKRATLLVIDDLGLERAGHEQVFMNVVDHRIGARLPTWATSGFSVDALTERYSQAFVRRICERGTGKLIDLFRASARKLEAVR
jgi:DNA replication protein DnaC